MKEIQSKENDIEIVTQVEAEKHYRLKKLGAKTLHEGHSCFELDLNTGLINYAKYIEEAVTFEDAQKGIQGVKRKLLVKDNHVYVTALNIKNAHKKFTKHLKGIR